MMPVKTRYPGVDRHASTSSLQCGILTFLFVGFMFAAWSNFLFLRSSADYADNFNGGGVEELDNKRNLLENQLQHLKHSFSLHNSPTARRRDHTLVIYIYNAIDEEQQRNFAYFLRYGITDGPTYRIIVTEGDHVLEFPKLPSLASNAQYIHTDGCTSTWGAIASVGNILAIPHEFIIVADSSARGPFLPSYVGDGLHWTEAFTNKIDARTKLVGATISCEGAPKGGDAAGEWRANPNVSPYAWATDLEGWKAIAADTQVMRCHKNKWDQRYYSDIGASTAILNKGYNLDTLMSRYQGVDWSDTSNWNCNQRVTPDNDLHYDGISITPYETVFVPVHSGAVDNAWTSAKVAEKYEEWMDRQIRPIETRPGIDSNVWISDHWTVTANKLIATNDRGPSCFDFEFYIRKNPDLKPLAQETLALWEHFLLLGQFQGRRHRFKCPVTVGNSFRVAYILARGPRCFDHKFYTQAHKDLGAAGLATSAQLFEHFAEFGQFERRKARFVCADSYTGLVAGFDNEKPAPVVKETKGGSKSNKRSNQSLSHKDKLDLSKIAMGEKITALAEANQGDPALKQALKSVLVQETAQDIFNNA